MDVNGRNHFLSLGDIDREDLWPKIREYLAQPLTFQFDFGLKDLPEEPGIIFVRGPRQYGKSTWLELSLKKTAEKFGPGSAFFLNGDEVTDQQDLETKISEALGLFDTRSKVQRLFVDEITAVDQWEKAIKRLADRGELKSVLLVTTGSKATDLRRGAERLPGRKGKLKRSEYVFTGISYCDFHAKCSKKFGAQTWIAYLLSGGSPIAAKEIWRFDRIPEYFYEINRDWILGEIAFTGRSRMSLLAVMKTLLRKGGSRLGYLNLAKESGLANNTLASEYVEQLSDLLSVIPSLQWDAQKGVPIQRKPCKFHFTNLSVALSFSENRISSIGEFKSLEPTEKSKWLEWLVAQELFRRQCILNVSFPEQLFYWSSTDHELDFVDAAENLYEVKLGKSGPVEFSWFKKVFPKKKLLVISESEFSAQNVKGVTIEQFLLADGVL